MKTCKKCGAPLEENATFCGKCGEKVSAETSIENVPKKHGYFWNITHYGILEKPVKSKALKQTLIGGVILILLIILIPVIISIAPKSSDKEKPEANISSGENGTSSSNTSTSESAKELYSIMQGCYYSKQNNSIIFMTDTSYNEKDLETGTIKKELSIDSINWGGFENDTHGIIVLTTNDSNIELEFYAKQLSADEGWIAVFQNQHFLLKLPPESYSDTSEVQDYIDMAENDGKAAYAEICSLDSIDDLINTSHTYGDMFGENSWYSDNLQSDLRWEINEKFGEASSLVDNDLEVSKDFYRAVFLELMKEYQEVVGISCREDKDNWVSQELSQIYSKYGYSE